MNASYKKKGRRAPGQASQPAGFRARLTIGHVHLTAVMNQCASCGIACALLARKYNCDISNQSFLLHFLTVSMNTKPIALSRDEIKEIAAIKVIREMWGARDASEMEALLDDSVYAVKFEFVSGAPGYVGDYFILQGDMLGEPPVQLIRKDGVLVSL
jgi:hypothetical protein